MESCKAIRRLRGVIERFTGSARLVIAASVEETASLGHSSVGTEHLLLGMLREPAGPAFAALTAAGVTLEAARARVIEVEGSVDGLATNERASFTTGARQLMEQALRDAVGFREHEIGPEHLLLALTGAPDSTAAALLDALGAPAERVRGLLFEEWSAPLRSPLGLFREPPSRCSLCGRSSTRVDRVIVGRAGTIYCERCVADAYRILEEARSLGVHRAAFRPTGSVPDDPDGATAAIERAFAVVFGALPVAETERVTALEDGAALHDALRGAREQRGSHRQDVEVRRVRFIDADEAEVIVSISTDGRPTLQTDAYAVCVESEWKVSRDAFWRILRLRGLE